MHPWTDDPPLAALLPWSIHVQNVDHFLPQFRFANNPDRRADHYFGSEIGNVALHIFAATTLDTSAGQMPGLLSAEYVPRIVVALAAAGWIDRVCRRPCSSAPTSSAAASVLGPAFGGALISIVGEPVAIATDGVSFLASVVALASLRASEIRPHARLRNTPPIDAILQGWHALLRQPTLRAFAATTFTVNFLALAADLAYSSALSWQHRLRGSSGLAEA